MLVLSRELGEQVMIGDDIIITVIETDGSEIKLGFAAPRDVKVHRREVWERIKKGIIVSEKPDTHWGKDKSRDKFYDE